MSYKVAIVNGDKEEIVNVFDNKDEAMECGKETFERTRRTVVCYKNDENSRNKIILLKTWY